MPSCEALLKNLQRALQSVDFNTAHDFLVKVKWNIPPCSDELVFLRVSSIAAEVADYFGEYIQARSLLAKIGPRCEQELTQFQLGSSLRLDASSRKLLKQKCWVLLHWGYTHYRQNKLEETRRLFQQCREIVQNQLKSSKDPCLGTRARIAYAIGLVHRESYEYREAKAEFGESVNLAWRKLEQETSGQQHAAAVASIIHFHLARCLGLGLGWIYYIEGLLQAARPLISAARVLISATRDKIMQSYVDVLYAASWRAASGSNPEVRVEVIQLLLKSHQLFNRLDHEIYRTVAAYELALAYHQHGNMEEANTYMQEVKEWAMAAKNARWLSRAFIIESRIHCAEKRGREAWQAANEAFKVADRLDPQVARFHKIEANMARGEANLLMAQAGDGLIQDKLEFAQRDFLTALEEGRNNDKVQSLCELQLAKCSLLLGNMREARSHLSQWQLLKHNIETDWIHKLGWEIEKEFQKKKHFVMDWEELDKYWHSLATGPIDYKKFEEQFHAFLAHWTSEKGGTINDAAKRIRVSVPTLRKWLNGGRNIGLPCMKPGQS